MSPTRLLMTGDGTRLGALGSGPFGIYPPDSLDPFCEMTPIQSGTKSS